MRIYRHIITSLLLLLVTLTTTAEEIFVQRGCRPRIIKRDVPACSRTARRAPANNPLVGDRRQLVVLVSFADRTFVDGDDETSTLTQWQRIFNEQGYSEASFAGSVYDYFYAQSYSQLRLTFDIQRVSLNENCVKYRSHDPDYGDADASDENSKYLVQDILNVLDTRDIDWSLYDWSGDGYIDQLLIIYAGMGMNDGGGKNSIWAHQYWLSLHDNCQERPVSSGGKTYKVDSYCCVPELSGTNDYGSFGTLCHEYSHCFGLPDFYYGKTSYVDNWDIMDRGNYNDDGFRPCSYSAHERMFVGWLTPEELTSKTIVSDMPATTDHAVAYLIRNDGHSDEYYIVENRQKTGWDKSLPGSGIVVFHIDYDAEVWLNSFPNSSSRQRYTIIPANNRSVSYSYGWAYPRSGNNALTNTSSPAATLLNKNSDETYLMNKPLTQMTVTNGLASFHFMDDGTGIEQPTSAACGAPQVVYRMGPVIFLRYPDGTVRKQIK